MADDPSRPAAYPFLEVAGPAERGLGRSLVTVALAAAAGVAASFAALAVVMIVAAGLTAAGAHVGFTAAIALLADGGRSGRGLLSYVYELAVVGSASFAAAGAFIAVAARRAGRSMRTFLTAAPRFRWRQALIGLLVFLPVVAAEIWLDGLANPGENAAPLAAPGASGVDRLIYAAAAVGFLWCAALAEELLFRGWLLQQTRALTRNVAAIVVVNAIAFSAAHGDFSPDGFVARLALGAGFAWLVLRLDGVEFTAGAHLANNLGLALLAKPVLLTAPAPEPFDGVSVALQVGTMAALVLAVEWWKRRRAAG